MGGGTGLERQRSLLLILLLVLPMLSVVQAQGGAVLIDEASFSVVDGATFETDVVSATLELNEVLGSSANVSITLLVQTLDGEVLSNQTQTTAEVLAGEVRNVSVMFTGLPYGHSVLIAKLTGEVGSNSSNLVDAVSATVQRLRPLSITLGGPGSVVPEGVNGNGQPTGNLTLQDGDHLALEFPVINDGDVNWTGGATVEVLSGAFHETVVLDNLSVQASSSQVVRAEPSLMLAEGQLHWWVNLTGDLGAEPGTHALNGSWTVGPPPLPVLNGQLTSDAANVQAGDQLTFSLTVWNNGSVPFSGVLSCVNDAEVLFDSNPFLLGSGTSSNWSFSTSAKPMTVSCTSSGDRIDATSTLPGGLNINMPSAVFESAGSSAPSLSGGPWHKGDEVTANLLLRNTGAEEGRVRLVLNVGSSLSQGDWVVLEDGSAGEVAVSLQFVDDGQQTIFWSLESDDGLIADATNGNISVVVRPQQSVAIGIENINSSAGQGTEFSVSLTLDEGVDRTVLLQVGYESSGATVFLQEASLLLQQGLHTFDFTFGDVKAERLVAQLAPVDWLIGPGPLVTTASLPDETTQFWMEFSSTTNPIRPVVGDDVRVELTLRQSGPYLGATGDVWIIDAYGTQLAKVQSPSWNDDDQTTITVNVIWPKGSTVGLQAMWQVNGEVVSAETTYVSGEVVVEANNEWPLAAIGWGLALGGAIVLVLRLQSRTPSPPKGPGSTHTSKPSSPSSPEEKREVSCPECDRRLRVPVSYTGSVGCPDCTHKFSVEASMESPSQASPPTKESDEVEVVSEEPEPLPAKIEIGCPECTQTLRIPRSYEGSVRCPACTHVFKAQDGTSTS
ncbi:MAG: hypothetical protein ACO2Y2_03185 [Poseidonia sp.]